MLFSLEVLQAKHGDCLLLHYGTMANRKIIVIDGGPGQIYKTVLKPRLLSIKAQQSPADPLPVSMVMISHADDDHINGIVDLTEDMFDKQTNGHGIEFAIDNLWFNSFDDIIGNDEVPKLTSLKGVDGHIAAVIASTNQGRTIRDNARKLGIPLNFPFQALKPGAANLVRAGKNIDDIHLDDLRIVVVHPNEKRLKELQAEWDKDLKKAKAKGDTNIINALIASEDKSPFNLSSIVCLVEYGGKRMLLTGDGRSDDILNGLELKKLLDDNGKLHVDILKMPHHGSKANMKADFLQRITADHYVISADGKHDNPDQELLDLMAVNVKKGVIHMTNHDGLLKLAEKMDAFVAKLKTMGSDLTVKFRDSALPSFILDLKDEKVNV